MNCWEGSVEALREVGSVTPGAQATAVTGQHRLWLMHQL